MPQRISSTIAAKSKESFGEDLPDKEYSFSKGFLHFLGQVYQETHKQQLPPTQIQKIEAEAKSIMQQLGDTSGSRSHAINSEFTAYMVAPYRILKASGTSVPQIRQLLEDALQHTMAWASKIVREQLDAAPDAFESLVKDSKYREQNFYVEPDFKLRRARDLPDSYSLEVHHCWYMRALEQLGAREIGPSFCAFDRSWYNAIDPQRHGVRFTRPSTIAKGADRCRFNFDRVKKTVKE
ncbi:L-2-amino-thiazoline-4-carboxylic acid hydrolase-domain-containing protein [Thelonectria olida]|uniref:L-2-amino-thiazoline-4-carboxylic acid hydrolase-domain-containing protein n=1 Tax=Thelonectria olida TaxID=1576542 RepID=A0A9P9AKE5_9HYPO|nr:L-2-amino-thiazoline-4-carboxylic acid hydrolase-domain-containing protein [Thelonectria olida]